MFIQTSQGDVINGDNISKITLQYQVLTIYHNDATTTVYNYTDASLALADFNIINSKLFQNPASPVSMIQWSTDNATWHSLPATANTSGLYFLVTGTGLSTVQNYQIDNGQQAAVISATSTTVNFQDFGEQWSAGTYSLTLRDASFTLVFSGTVSFA